MKIKFPRDLFILILALILLAYTVFRAYYLSFTIDEGFSFITYVLDSYTCIINFKILDPNNHVLNTVLMKFFSTILPLSEFTLRIPAIIGHLLYMFFTWKILKSIPNFSLMAGGWLLMNLNPFMLDFFSLARGYGLSWGLLAGSLFFLKQFFDIETKKGFNLIFCFLFGALAVLASFPVLNFYLVLSSVLILLFLFNAFFQKGWWRKNKKWLWYTIPVLFIGSYILLPYVFAISFKLSKAGYLYFGGIGGFWQDTVGSILENTLFGQKYSPFATFVLYFFAILVPVVSCFYLSAKFLKQKKLKPGDESGSFSRKYSFFVFLLATLIFIAIGLELQHIILDTRYVLERAAFFILVVFMLVFIFLVSHLFRKNGKTIIGIFFALVSVIHFGYSANTSYFFAWKSQASTREVMQDLNKIHASGSPNKPMYFQPEWLFTTATMFYQYLYHYTWMEPIESVKIFNGAEDYYYFPEDDLHELKGQPVSIVKRYPLSKTVLLKNIGQRNFITLNSASIKVENLSQANASKPSTISIKKDGNVSYIELGKDVFSPDIVINADMLLPLKNIFVFAKAKVNFPYGKGGEFYIKIQDKNGKILSWQSLGFVNYLLQKDGWITVPFKIIIKELDPEAAHINIGIWNTGKNPIFVSELSGEIKIIPGLK